MGDEDGFGALEVGVGGHDGVARGFACSTSAVAHAAMCAEQDVDRSADEEPEVGGDLLVAAAAGVELEAEVADGFGEAQLDEVVNVFGLGSLRTRCAVFE